MSFYSQQRVPRAAAIPLAFCIWLNAVAGTGAAQQSRPDPPGEMVEAGGHRIHLYCQGQGHPAVILVPTMGGFSVDWTLVQSAVAGTVQVCSWDRAGSAWSDRSAHFGEIDAEVIDLSEVLRNTGIQPPYVLAGHAYGALVVRDFQRLHPGDVAGMVLVDSLFEEQAALTSFETGQPAPLLDFSEKNLRESLAAYPPVEFTPAAPRVPADSLERLAPAQQIAHLWADNQWQAALRAVTPTQWATIMGSAIAAYRALYGARYGSAFPLGKIPLAVITTSGEEDEKREAEFARQSEHGWQILAPRSGYPSPLEQPGFVVEEILKVVAMAHATASH